MCGRPRKSAECRAFPNGTEAAGHDRTRLRIGIIGGGIGGLTMALALRQRGMQADVEDRFGIRIPNDDRKRFVTPGDAVDFLQAAGAER